MRRRRECSGCGGRFTTFERVQLRELIVIKSTGKKAPFDREKLLRSIAIATRKRELEPDRIDQMVSGIVRQLESLGEAEVDTSKIGELVLEGLAKIDDVAYVRYASVYKNFSEAGDFAQFLGGMKDDNK